MLVVEKAGGGVGDDMPFNSLVLQYFRLYVLHHAIPPPWDSHLSNRLTEIRTNEKKSENRNVYDKESNERGYQTRRQKNAP
jgi:hypothetical protein